VYFVILEDRLRTTKATGRARRSAQTVLFEVASSLSRLLAPILSFTAEEAWQQLPGRPVESVFLAGLPQPTGPLEPELAERYSRLLAVRGAVQAVVQEALREQGLGTSLEARVVLSASGEARAFLAANVEELPALFRVSQVELEELPGPKARPLALARVLGNAEMTAEIRPAWGARCPRCGGFAEEVEQGSEVCPRCREALG
jgi:isoleucyl-tRNA synthetase